MTQGMSSTDDDLDKGLDKWLWNLVATAQHPVHGKNLTSLNYTKDHVKQLITVRKEQWERESRIDELERLSTSRHYGKDYQESLDELDEYKDRRIAELKKEQL